MSVLLLAAAAVLCSCGTWLLLDRHLSRVVIGIGLLGHGVNILLVLSGGDGGAPAFIEGEAAGFADPLPQGMVLAAIVITFGVIAFLLAMAHRSWSFTADDEVEDDVEDRRIAAESHEHESHEGEDG